MGDHYREVKQFARGVLVRVQVVGVHVFREVVGQHPDALRLPLGGHHDAQVLAERPDPAALPRLPQVPGHVERDGLQEQHHAHPLVVLVVSHLVTVPGRRHAGVRDVLSDAAVRRPGQRVRRVDPAVRVHHLGGHPLHHAVDGVAHVLLGRDHHREERQRDQRRLVMEPEHVVVHAHAVDLQQTLQRLEEVEHVLHERLELEGRSGERTRRVGARGRRTRMGRSVERVPDEDCRADCRIGGMRPNRRLSTVDGPNKQQKTNKQTRRKLTEREIRRFIVARRLFSGGVRNLRPMVNPRRLAVLL